MYTQNTTNIPLITGYSNSHTVLHRYNSWFSGYPMALLIIDYSGIELSEFIAYRIN